ncbi:MAG: hypothetical protein CMH42_04710 [Micrococcales bacterium]|nr:hypothetical protein [Micrococcales bacterium]
MGVRISPGAPRIASEPTGFLAGLDGVAIGASNITLRDFLDNCCDPVALGHEDGDRSALVVAIAVVKLQCARVRHSTVNT